MFSDNNSGFSHIWKARRDHGRWMYAVVLILCVLIADLSAHGRSTLRTVYVDEIPVEVEIADTVALRSRGLMQRAALAANTGMLFVYAEPHLLQFWMKDTPLDLDIGFFDEHGRLLHIEQMQAYDDVTRHSARSPAKYALEVNRNWFARHHIGPGARLRFANGGAGEANSAAQ